MRAFVVWEPVLPTDWTSPSSLVLSLVSDLRASQYWDKRRLISHSMGEHDLRSVVWDHIGVYAPGAMWQNRPPPAAYEGGPVVNAADAARAALRQALDKMQRHH